MLRLTHVTLPVPAQLGTNTAGHGRHVLVAGMVDFGNQDLVELVLNPRHRL